MGWDPISTLITSALKKVAKKYIKDDVQFHMVRGRCPAVSCPP